MRRFVIGDIHGAHRALMQCFERSDFDRKNDLLICLGDFGDGWPDVDRVFTDLLTVENLVTLLGNHDRWLLDWLQTGDAPLIWLSQGGSTTIKSLESSNRDLYRSFLEKCLLYYQLDNYLFVHGGIHTDKSIKDQDENIFLWDRTLIRKVLNQIVQSSDIKLTDFEMVFVGHTPTINFGPATPIIKSGVCMMDTGAGWPGGVLTMMDIDSSKTFSSDYVDHLYPGFSPR